MKYCCGRVAVAPSVSETTKHLLREALKELGSLEELAIALKSPIHLVQAWMSGHATMPSRKLLLLIDALEKRGRQ